MVAAGLVRRVQNITLTCACAYAYACVRVCVDECGSQAKRKVKHAQIGPVSGAGGSMNGYK